MNFIDKGSPKYRIVDAHLDSKNLSLNDSRANKDTLDDAELGVGVSPKGYGRMSQP